MSKAILIISTHVDSSIREQLPLDKILVYSSIDDLGSYILSTPVRADTMYITRDVLGVAVNTKLAYLMDMLKNPFLSVKEIIYVTETGSKEIVSVNFMIEENGYTNWVIQYGSLNREYVTQLIAGTLRTEDIKPRRKTVYRVDREEYIANKLKAGKPDEKFPIDEVVLSDIPDEEVPEPQISEVPKNCKIQVISGLPGLQRSVFALLYAQYLSFSGKVLVIERDVDYMQLTGLFHSSGVKFDEFEMEELYSEPKEVIRRVRNSTERIILFTDRTRSNFEVNFVGNILYNNLQGDIDYLVVEKDFEELSPTTKYTTVIRNTVPDIIRTVEEMPMMYPDQTRFALLNMNSFPEFRVPNTKQAGLILGDLLQEESLKLMILNVKSLKLGGEAHDLRMYTF